MSNYNSDLQSLIAGHIQLKYQSSHIYRSLGLFFSHPNVAYPGFSSFFRKLAERDLVIAEDFTNFHHNRGSFISPPALTTFDINLLPSNALKQTVLFEDKSIESLRNLYIKGDPQTQAFIIEHLNEATQTIARINGLLTKVTRFETDTLGLHSIDNELLADLIKHGN